MAGGPNHALAILIVVVTMGLATVSVTAQSPIDVEELAEYRLATDVFRRFVQANGRIVDITRHDAAFTDAPLFTNEVALAGDAVVEAAGLMARLANHAGLAAALEAAKITPREYAKFAITLIAARLAHGFLKAGVLPSVPPGAPSINVEFVKTHESDVIAALEVLDIP